jgi:hypothetical protein
MSVQGLQRTQQLLQVIGTQLPSIAQASETPALNLEAFIIGAVIRSGVQVDKNVSDFIVDLANLIGAPSDLPPPPTRAPLDDRIADT